MDNVICSLYFELLHQIDCAMRYGNQQLLRGLSEKWYLNPLDINLIHGDIY